jgi:hypothetical protein
LALLAISGPAHATKIIYDGATQGQLDIFDNPIKLKLVPGTDIVEGSFLWANGKLLFGDGFGFIVPHGHTLDGMSYAYSNLVVTPNVFDVAPIPNLADTGPDGRRRHSSNSDARPATPPSAKFIPVARWNSPHVISLSTLKSRFPQMMRSPTGLISNLSGSLGVLIQGLLIQAYRRFIGCVILQSRGEGGQCPDQMPAVLNT